MRQGSGNWQVLIFYFYEKLPWGINLYPEIRGDDFIEFDSMTNLRPSQGNRSRGVEDMKIQEKIKTL
jgi:hypothetical protein